jgi:hypothetical protein
VIRARDSFERCREVATKLRELGSEGDSLFRDLARALEVLAFEMSRGEVVEQDRRLRM